MFQRLQMLYFILVFSDRRKQWLNFIVVLFHWCLVRKYDRYLTEECFVDVQRCTSASSELLQILIKRCHLCIYIERADLFFAYNWVNLLVGLTWFSSKTNQAYGCNATYANAVCWKHFSRLCWCAFLWKEAGGWCCIDTSVHIRDCNKRDCPTIVLRIGSWRCLSANHIRGYIINRYLLPRWWLWATKGNIVNKEALVDG